MQSLTNKEMKKILVVDDDVNLVKILKELLEMEGYEIREAFNGEEAIDKAHEYMPNLILLDIMMPLMDGWEVCRRLKACKKTSHIPVAILTARTGEEDKRKAAREGAVDYIPKPFQIEDFIQRIERAFND